jgi:hypothetical protein
VQVSKRDRGKDKVGKDSSRRLTEWRGSVFKATSVSCHVDYTGIRKVLGCTRRWARHMRKNISSWAAASTESDREGSREGGARRRYRAQVMVNDGGWQQAATCLLAC